MYNVELSHKGVKLPIITAAINVSILRNATHKGRHCETITAKLQPMSLDTLIESYIVETAESAILDVGSYFYVNFFCIKMVGNHDRNHH